MPSKLRALASKGINFARQNKGKIAIGLGATALVGAGAYALNKFSKTRKSKRQTLAKIRTKRRIMQEKVKLERAKKSYERAISQ